MRASRTRTSRRSSRAACTNTSKPAWTMSATSAAASSALTWARYEARGRMKLAIEHETVYRYDAPVRSSTQYIRLTPRETPSLNVRQWQIDTPRAATQTQDGYGNVLHVLTLDKPVREIRIRAHGVVETTQLPEEKPEPAAKLSPLVFLRSTTLTRPDEALGAFA